MAQRVVALELAGEYVRAAVADRSWNSFELIGVFEQERADDEADLSGALARLLAKTGQPSVLISALPGEFVAKRLLELPFTDKRRLNQVVPFALEEHMPFAIDDAAVAFNRVGRENDKTLVLAALARKADLEHHLELLSRAGLDPKIVTLGPFALAGILTRSRNGSAVPHVVLDMDQGSSSMVLIDAEGMPRALRTVSQGLDLRNNHVTLEQGAASAILGTLRQTLLAHGSEGQLPELILAGPAAGVAEVRKQIGEALTTLVNRINDLDCSSLIAGGKNEPARFNACLAMLLGEAPGKPLELLNFRQGEFSYRGHSGVTPYRVPLILGSIAVGFALIHFFLGIAVGARELELLNREISATVAPALTKTDPTLAKPELDAKLKEMRKNLRLMGGNLGHGSPLDLLLALSQTIPPGVPMQVYDMQIDDSGIKIQGTADSYGAVDQVKKALERSPQFEDIKVDHAAASSSEGKIDFTISTAPRDTLLGMN
ncbi:MAG TPA: type II secretion system protein GspL [Candidatus Binataceae bacterium]|nr:type II secretion system protein GspL [Candidatus Binataceae bacterium]